ncbi:MAG: ribosomal protein S18 acetylase RimI-like enzyme [Crocinitomicaceae bacterium]
MNNLKIRLANPSDAEAISLLGGTTFTETFGHFFRDHKDLQDYLKRTFSIEKIKNGLGNSSNVFWIALVNDLPVGFSKLKRNSKSEFSESINSYQLQKIYVLKDYLSMKIGLALQDRLIETATEEGFDQIWLSVLDSNERASRFYFKNGFEKIGSHDFQIGKESFEFIAMSKNLTSSDSKPPTT